VKSLKPDSDAADGILTRDNMLIYRTFLNILTFGRQMIAMAGHVLSTILRFTILFTVSLRQRPFSSMSQDLRNFAITSSSEWIEQF